MRPIRTLVPILAALTLSACAPRGGVATGPTPMSDAERVRADSIRLPYTEADITFMSGMIGHHAQAILISRWAPTHTQDPELRTLASRIINAQTDDITLMTGWLRDRGKPVPSVSPEGVFTPAPPDPNDPHAGHQMGGHDHSTMAGMLSPEQLVELDAARGEAFDLLFLQRMIVHHRGAITMVRDLIRDGGAIDEVVFRFASDVEVDQSTEIARMLQMLLERGGLPPE
ncbi:MAG TPA: DUF305 domain-containing protein [Gemmatimonadaceae bacterium]|nr:DUF305 domain-containing protein [Gemmatimonadaceae bacterium]HRQ77886.1 DUF305 domain-containing protein [Gemmatimonadaceae bacterium]